MENEQIDDSQTSDLEGNYKPSQPLKKSLSKLEIWLIASLAIIIFCGAVASAYYYKIKKDDKKTATTQSTTSTNSAGTVITDNTGATSSASATSSSTADWKTYTSFAYNFSFKYPSDWLAQDSTGIDQPLQVQVSSPTDNAEQPVSFTLTVDKVDSVDSLVKLNSDRYGSMTNFQKTSISFAGENATQITYQDNTPRSGTGSNKTIIFSQGGYSYVINGNDKSVTGAMDKVNSIFSSLQFTDLTAGWKTFTDKDYGFSFKYPTNWTLGTVTSPTPNQSGDGWWEAP